MAISDLHKAYVEFSNCPVPCPVEPIAVAVTKSPVIAQAWFVVGYI